MSPAKKAAADADPIALRERLYEKLDRAETRADDNSRAISEGRIAVHATHTRLAEARIAEVMGDADPALIDELRTDVERMEREVAEALDMSQVIGAAVKRIRRDIEQLHDREREAFIADARVLADEAAAALEALREPYTAAYEAWGRSQTRYAQFVRDLDDISPAPSWPWPSPVELFYATSEESRTGRIGPRLPIPHELREDAPVREPAAPGTRHVYEREDGQRLTADAGDALDSTLDSEPAWRLVEVHPPIDS
jgi:hypothetical protein